MADTLVNFIIVLFFIITILLILAWFFIPKTFKKPSDKPKQQPSTGPAGFLQPCSTVIECVTGLVCDNNVCKKVLGGSCETISDCSSEANTCINGLCIVAGTGDVNEPPPCMEGLTPNDNNICKLLPGQTCETDIECISFVCDDNKCKESLKIGEKCLPEQCETQLHCSSGFCQSDNVETGEEGSFCRSFKIEGDFPRCNTDNLCIRGDILGTFPPICAKRTEKSGEVCTNDTGNGPFCLFNMECSKPNILGQSICTTKYQYYDCKETSQCSLGYVCIEDRCEGNGDTLCFTTKECKIACVDEKFSSRWIDDGIFWTRQFSVPQFFDRIEQNFILGTQASNWGLKLPKTGVKTSDTGFYYKKQTSEWKKILNINNPEGDILDFGVAINPMSAFGLAKPFVLISKSMSTKFAIYTVDIHQDGSGKLSIYTDNIDLPGLKFFDIGPTFLNTVVVSNDKNIWVSDENLITKHQPVNITFKMLTTANVTKLAKPRLYASCLLDKDTGECIFVQDINDLNISYINQTDPTRDRMIFNGPLSIIDNYPINDSNWDQNELKIFDYQVQSNVDSVIDDIIVTIAGMTGTGNISESIIFQIQGGIQWTIPGETSEDVSLYQSQTDSTTPNINIITSLCAFEKSEVTNI